MAQESGPSSHGTAPGPGQPWGSTPEESEPPVGLTFAPSDEQLVVWYLRPYAAGLSLQCDGVVEAGVYSTEPWSLLGADREIGYFLTKRTRHGKRVKRTAGGGTWNGQAKKQEVVSAGGEVVGFKALFSFCINDDDDEGCSQKPHKKTTGYVMYEYELPPANKGAGQQGTSQEPVLCCIKKSAQEIARSHKRKRAEAAAQAPAAGTSTATAYVNSVDKRARHPTQISEAGLLQHENSNGITSCILAPPAGSTPGFADSSTFTDEEALALAALSSCQFAADRSSALPMYLYAAALREGDCADAVNLVSAGALGMTVATTNADFFKVGECSYNHTIPEYTDSVTFAGFGTSSSTYAADYNTMPLPTMAWYFKEREVMTDDINLAFRSAFGMMNADRFDGLGGDMTVRDIVSTTAVEGAGDRQPPSLPYELTGMTTMAATAEQQLLLPPDQDKQTVADDVGSLDQRLSLLDKDFSEWFDSLLNAEPSPPPLVDSGSPFRNCRIPPLALSDGTASSEVATSFTSFSC